MLDMSYHAGRNLQGDDYHVAYASMTGNSTPLFSVWRRARGPSQ